MHYSLCKILNTFVEHRDHFHPERNDLRFCGGKFLLTIYLIDCLFICGCKHIRAIYFSSQLSLLLFCLGFGRVLLGGQRTPSSRDIRWFIRSSGMQTSKPCSDKISGGMSGTGDRAVGCRFPHQDSTAHQAQATMRQKSLRASLNPQPHGSNLQHPKEHR